MKTSQDEYWLTKTIYTFYGDINAFLADVAIFKCFIKIIVVLDSSYFKTHKTVSSSSFAYKTFGDRWRPSVISHEKGGKWNK